MADYEKEIKKLIDSLFVLDDEISRKIDDLKYCSDVTKQSNIDDLNRTNDRFNQKMELLKELNK